MSKKLYQHLDYLITASPPAELRKSLLHVFMRYLIADHESLPEDFESIACDFQLLIEFLDEAEESLLD